MAAIWKNVRVFISSALYSLHTKRDQSVMVSN